MIVKIKMSEKGVYLETDKGERIDNVLLNPFSFKKEHTTKEENGVFVVDTTIIHFQGSVIG